MGSSIFAPKWCAGVLSAAAIVAAMPGMVRAAVVINVYPAVDTNSVSTFPTAPDVITVDANQLSPGARGITGTRVEEQSFQLGSDLTVGTIYLSAGSYSNNPFTISFFPVADATGDLTATGAQAGNTITVPAFGSSASGTNTIEVDLSGTDLIHLSGGAAPAGYVMSIASADGSSTVFSWDHSNDGTDHYPQGHYLRDDGDVSTTRDFGLALAAAPSVPEPATISLLAIGAAGMLVRRRRRA